MFLWQHPRVGAVSLIDSILGVAPLSGPDVSDMVSVGEGCSVVVYSQLSQSSSNLSLLDCIGADVIRRRLFLQCSCPSGVRMLYDLGSDGIHVMTSGFLSLPILIGCFVPVEGELTAWHVFYNTVSVAVYPHLVLTLPL